MNIDPKQIDLLKRNAQPFVEAMTRRKKYYDGDHKIMARHEKYADGTKKSNRVTNFMKYIVEMYSGAMTAQPYQVVGYSETGESSGFDEYKDVSEFNALPAQDIENLKNCLIYGMGVEFYGADSDGHLTITNTDPREWMIFRDMLDNIQCAVRCVKLPIGVVFQEGEAEPQILTQPLDLVYVYTDSEIIDYKKERGEWVEILRSPHFFDRVPVTVWQINDSREPILTDDLLGQQDEYNDIDSASGDEIRQFVNSILCLKGYNPMQIKEQAGEIQEKRMLGLDADGDAFYLTRELQTSPYDVKLGRVRQAIHLMGQVPDIESIVGATGSTSGIALKLKFMPMIQRAKSISQYIKMGLTERITIINAHNKKVRGQANKLIENYQISIGFYIPTNKIEEWQNIGALTGIVSHLTQLELLTDIENPDIEMIRLKSDAELKPQNTGGLPKPQGIEPDGTDPAIIAAKNEQAVEAIAAKAEPMVKQLIQSIDIAIQDAIIKSGAIERAAAARK